MVSKRGVKQASSGVCRYSPTSRLSKHSSCSTSIHQPMHGWRDDIQSPTTEVTSPNICSSVGMSSQRRDKGRLVVERSSPVYRVSTHRLTVPTFGQQTISESHDETQSPLTNIISPNTYFDIGTASQKRGKQGKSVVGRSSPVYRVSTHRPIVPTLGQQTISEPDDVNQSPLMRSSSPCTDSDVVGTSKKVRRNSRSLGLDKMRGSNKIPIEICKITGNPVGLHSEKFSSEVGIITRLFAAPDALKWRCVSAENKATLFRFLREKFIFSKDTYAIEGVLTMMKERYKNYQYQLRQRFRKHPTLKLALADVPNKISKVA